MCRVSQPAKVLCLSYTHPSLRIFGVTKYVFFVAHDDAADISSGNDTIYDDEIY